MQKDAFRRLFYLVRDNPHNNSASRIEQLRFSQRYSKLHNRAKASQPASQVTLLYFTLLIHTASAIVILRPQLRLLRNLQFPLENAQVVLRSHIANGNLPSSRCITQPSIQAFKKTGHNLTTYTGKT